jgi:DNA-binding beta-propeller fold protein YncE
MKFHLLIAACAAGFAAVTGAAYAQTGASGLKVVARIAGPDGHWDYASFDPARRRIYIAHGDQVLTINADTGQVNPAFASGSHLHAVVPVPGEDRIVTTNSGDSSARVIDAGSGALLASIPAAADTDSAAYDPSTGLVVVIGGDSGEITLVDPKALKAVGAIKVGGSLEFGMPDGAGRFYVNAADTHEIVVIDLTTRTIVKRYPMPGCLRPTGMAYVEGGRVISACPNGVAKIVDAASGREIASLPIGAGADAVIYDRARKLAYIPSGWTGTLAVIALEGPAANTVIDTVTTQKGARTGAVDPKTGRIYLPTADFGPQTAPGERPPMKPGSFTVLVLDR